MSVSRLLLIFVAFQIISLDMALAVTLDDKGTGPPRTFFTCRGVNLDGSAGGNPFFKIKLKGQCTKHAEGQLLAWTVHDWKNVVALGDYNYDLKTATEDVFQGPDIIFSLVMNCNKNPWAHGVWSSGCSPSGNVNNKTGTIVNGPYPLSAKYMDTQLLLAIKKAESTPTTAELLNDWNPYENTGGASAMDVKKPTSYESLPDSIPYYLVDIQKKPNFAPINAVSVEVEALEEAPELVGDIALPKTNTHWWQPLWDGAIPASAFPFPFGVSNGLFSGKTGKFRLRARGKKPGTNNKFVGGWTVWRNFCIGLSNCSNSDQQIKAAAVTSKLIKQAQVQNMMNKNKNKSINGPAIGKIKPSFGAKTPTGKSPQPQSPKTAKLSKKQLSGLPGVKQKSMKKTSGPTMKPYAAMNNSSTNMAKAPTMKSVRLKRLTSAILAVDRVAVKPVPTKAGDKIDLDIRFKNTGQATSNANKKYILDCQIVKGSTCPVPDRTAAIGAINAGGSKSIILLGANDSKAGEYKLLINVEGNKGRPWTVKLNVAPKIKIRASTVKKITPIPRNNSSQPSAAPTNSAPRINIVPR